MTVTSSLHRLADACILPGFAGASAPDWVRRRVAGGLGGVVLYNRNTPDRGAVARLTASLRDERAGVLVAMDEEGGDVTRLEVATGSSYPGNLALGAAGDLDLTRAVGACLGADLAAVGVDIAFGPVADVNSNPSNPVIGVRSFGGSAAGVAAHTVAMVEGIQSQQVAACVKHFPGHGDTAEDSHLVLPTVPAPADRLDAVELVPFRAALDAGVRCVMTAHLLVPAYDARSPATLSRPIITGLLRERFGFDGLVITDGMEMRAIADTVGVPEGAVLALSAGVDAVCLGGGHTDEAFVDAVRDALVTAVRAGRLPETRLAEAADRMNTLSTWTHTLRDQPPPTPDRAAGLTAARRAIQADGNPRIWNEPTAGGLTLRAHANTLGDQTAPHGGETTSSAGIAASGETAAGGGTADGNGTTAGGETATERETAARALTPRGQANTLSGETAATGETAHGDKTTSSGETAAERATAAEGWTLRGQANTLSGETAASGGTAAGAADVLLVELSPVANIAAGAAPWGLARLLPADDPAVEVVRVAGKDAAAAGGVADATVAAGGEAAAAAGGTAEGAAADEAGLAGRAAGREVVVVVRDLHRHAWQQRLVERLTAAAARVVVVEMGVPVLRPAGAAAHVRTYGAGRVNARAALELLGRAL